MNIAETQTLVAKILEENFKQADNADFASNIVLMLQSEPGLGKTSIVEAVCAEQDWDLDTVPLASYDATEMGGFPIPDPENMVYNRATPFWLKNINPNRKRVIFFDELSQAPTPNHNVVAMLVNERKLGEHKLPDNVAIVCAGNAMQHRAGTNPLPSHLKDRLTFINVETDPSSD